MGQRYKNVYFADHPADAPQKRSLTLAFGERDADLYEVVRVLSSQELRELLGHASYGALQLAAAASGSTVNAYCLRQLRERRSVGAAPADGADEPLGIDPIQATFRGGQAEPLHGWYPFLEGYSPGFVEQALAEFAPQAERVLDPFAGAGTTPLTVARLGRDALYCELNPVLQYLTAAKLAALTAAEAARRRLAEALRALAERLPAALAEAPPDAELARAYAAAFGESRFFDDETLALVLRARTLLDRLACADPPAAQLAAVAVLASLVPASRLIRRGDLRYKTPEEAARLDVTLTAAVQARLAQMAGDLERVTAVERRPILVCEDARQLGKLPPLDVDAVITSPPYLNGTNYFRNTKVELWFLRCLRSAADLAGFRRRTVTAGINDVTLGKANGHLPSGRPAAGSDEPERTALAEVVAQVAAGAYDQRIPRMVASYFADVRAVFAGLRPHLRDGAPVLVDIGDSAYGEVHVPTDRLLVELLGELGLALEREVTLRRRLSRGGFPLRHVLLVLRAGEPGLGVLTGGPRAAATSAGAPTPIPDPAPPAEPDGAGRRWSAAWARFRRELPHQQGDFAKRNWGHPLHSLCSYQGKMKPSLAAHLVETFVPPGGVVLDPFAGVGTIPFEAALRGSLAWAFEISPAALQIAAAKLAWPDPFGTLALLDELAAYLIDRQPTPAEEAAAGAIHFNGPLPDYFAPATFREVLLARRFFRERPPRGGAESLVFACLLHILHGNRPYALSRHSHPITPFAPTGPAEYRPLAARLREKVQRSLEVSHPQGFQPGRALYQDATSWWPQEVDELDAVVTSPPFFDSTRFYLANWLRLWFCGWEADDFRTQPLAFVDERQKASFEVYEPVFRQARERLRPGGVCVLHLGRSRKCDMAAALSRLAARWFRVADLFAESVEHCESHGIRDKGTVEEHVYLVLE